MKYLLDTCTLSDFAKGHPQVLARIKATAPEWLAVSSLTRMEVEYGLALNPERARKLAPVMQQVFSSITTLPFSTAEAQAAASIRAALMRQGQPIGPYDLLIAATALTQGLIMVTSNVSEFRRISGLRIEDWREG